ncbi:Hypothetical protein NF53_2958 [Bacillus thuringiensis serovar indiana]|nr:Hypothetical protein NF53_2958 [Bacillus thuringiensis serovar indiana]ETE87579.1 hypothetical protein C621_0231155 [Bacillus thuringiensis serovar aizawai str. Leapi01]ETE98495.1 hypothetical protein C623_0209145 [Bacillus thuringiensis serovar aizawai str. Hu4-2]QDD84343.1 hypothetical protein FORC087_3049 [Bacillus cereus]
MKLEKSVKMTGFFIMVGVYMNNRMLPIIVANKKIFLFILLF